MNRLKLIWAMMPLKVKVIIQGAASAAVGGAFTALVIWSASGKPVKELWPLILVGAGVSVRTFFTKSLLPAYQFEKAVERGEAIDRRQS